MVYIISTGIKATAVDASSYLTVFLVAPSQILICCFVCVQVVNCILVRRHGLHPPP